MPHLEIIFDRVVGWSLRESSNDIVSELNWLFRLVYTYCRDDELWPLWFSNSLTDAITLEEALHLGVIHIRDDGSIKQIKIIYKIILKKNPN
jgi:hypothetical protein